MVNITNYVLKESLTKKMTSLDSLELLQSFMKITPASEDIEYTENLKKDDSLLDDVEVDEIGNSSIN